MFAVVHRKSGQRHDSEWAVVERLCGIFVLSHFMRRISCSIIFFCPLWHSVQDEMINFLFQSQMPYVVQIRWADIVYFEPALALEQNSSFFMSNMRIYHCNSGSRLQLQSYNSVYSRGDACQLEVLEILSKSPTPFFYLLLFFYFMNREK